MIQGGLVAFDRAGDLGAGLGRQFRRLRRKCDGSDEGGGKRGYYEGEGALIVDSPQGFLTVYTDSDA